MKISLPNYVMSCIKILKSNGFEAYCVGGGIRDLLLGKKPYDFDITTSAQPSEVMRLFPKNVPTGIKHGTVTVVTEGGSIEVTTYRTEQGYSDSRHPDSVTFVGNIGDDLARRDFTVNAIGYDGEHFVSEKSSFSDLEERIIRAVGEPEKRFREDALRIMRCFRFAAQLGFGIEQSTLTAALKNKHALANVSAERIAAELEKILCSDYVILANPLLASELLNCVGLKPYELPERFSALPKAWSIRLAAFIYLSGSNASEVCNHLKLSNKLRQEILYCFELFEGHFSSTRAELKKVLRYIPYPLFEQILAGREIIFGENLCNAKAELKNIIDSGEAYTVKMLAVSGNDLVLQGFKGEEIGKELERLLLLAINEPTLNTKNKLLEISEKDI